MFSIGEFAQAGPVSVRRLRHRPAGRGQPIAYYEDCPDGVLVHAALRSPGYDREPYIECGPEFVTELQEPVITR